MRKSLAFFCLLFSFTVCYSQQTDSTAVDTGSDDGFIEKPDNSAPFRIGVKFGAGYSALMGTELANSSGTFSIQGSVYGRYRFVPGVILQAELGASFRGSNFNNDPGEFSSIKTYYLDVPVYLVYGLNKTENVNVVAGVQYSYLINSSMYISTNAAPLTESPGLARNDLLGLLGMQFNTAFVSFQVLGKYGLTNINSGNPWPSTDNSNGPYLEAKPNNTGGSIHNFVFEIDLIF